MRETGRREIRQKRETGEGEEEGGRKEGRREGEMLGKLAGSQTITITQVNLLILQALGHHCICAQNAVWHRAGQVWSPLGWLLGLSRATLAGSGEWNEPAPNSSCLGSLGVPREPSAVLPGHVQDPLGHHEAHPEEEVAGWEEG